MSKHQVERYKDLGIGDKRINIEAERKDLEDSKSTRNKSSTYTFSTNKAQANIARILKIFKSAKTATQAADLLCTTRLTVCNYIRHINRDDQKVKIVGMDARAPIYQTIDESAQA